MKFINNKKVKIHCAEKFLNKILKNGLKYKYFIYLKKSLILFRKLKLILHKINMKNIQFSPNLFEDSLVEWYLPEYSVTYLLKKDMKSKKRIKILKGFIIKIDNNAIELYKWIYLILYRLPIRSFQLKIFYLLIALYCSEEGLLLLANESKAIFSENILTAKKKFKWKKITYTLKKKHLILK